jgi:hypothetical protein
MTRCEAIKFGTAVLAAAMHWYVFGPAWTKQETEHQLEIMAAAHIRGVLVFPTYPIAVDDPAREIRNQPYLSREFLEVLNHAASTCKRLGIEVFHAVPTGMQVKRAALGAEGWIVNHHNSKALRKYLREVGDKLLDSVPAGSVRSVFCDSFKVYRTNWTPDFPEIFQRLYGDYSVLVLPNLTGIAIASLETIVRFSEAGGKVIVTRR